MMIQIRKRRQEDRRRVSEERGQEIRKERAWSQTLQTVGHFPPRETGAREGSEQRDMSQ